MPPETAAEAPVPPDAGSGHERAGHVRDTITIAVLSITALLTAWCGFESSKWGGEMSISFSQASSTRIEAARQQGIANNARQIDLSVWSLYVEATAEDNTELRTYVQQRFSDEFAVAFDAWVEAGRPNSGSVQGPFAMPEYVPPGTQESAAADQRAEQLFAQGLTDNRRGDNYTILTVLAALVLFFAALSGRLPSPRAQWMMLGFAMVLLVTASIIAATFPVIV